MAGYLNQLDSFADIDSVTCQGCNTVFDTAEVEVDEWNFWYEGNTTTDCCMSCFHKFKVEVN